MNAQQFGDHMMKMIAMFRQVEELGGNVDAEEQSDMVNWVGISMLKSRAIWS